MEKYKTLFRNKEISFRVGGTGGVLVLLHGFTESQNIWDHFAGELSCNHKVVTVDLPGHGESECIAEIHTMELLADCVDHVLVQAGVDECVMVGHSMGGYVALAYAEKFPDKIKGLGMFHSSALADSAEAKENRERAIKLIRENYTSFVMAFIPDLFTPENRQRYKTEIDKLVLEARKMSAQSIIAAQEGMKIRPDRTHILAKADYPVLFMLGKLDSRVPFEKALQQVALPDDAVLLSMGDVAHMGYIEAREKTLYALKVFLEGIY